MRCGVLFVDDEELVRRHYATLSENLEDVYDVHTAASADEAMLLMQQHRFDVVVTDLNMPDIDGLQFLGHVARSQPDCARFIVSGFEDRINIARYLFVGHRYFSKPVPLELLANLLRRLATFRDIIANDKVRRLIGGVGSLPGPPEIFLKLEGLLQNPTTGIDEIGALVEQDPAVSAKLLQIVNSAHFGLPTKVVSITDAIQLIGLSSLRALVLGLHAFSAYNGQPGKRRPSAELWNHSLEVASMARRVARERGFSHDSAERAFLAGLLHDVGRIVINANAADEYAEVLETAEKFRIPVIEAEERRFGATYAQIGAYLLALWGIDDEVISLVQFQDTLADYNGSDLLALASLHVAHHAIVNNPQAYPIQSDILEQLGFPAAETWLTELAPA